MPDLALWDLVAPYWLLGNAAGNAHAAFSVLAVDTYEQASDGSSSVIRGRANFFGEVRAFFDPTNLSFGIHAENTEGHPLDDPSRRDPWIDMRDTAVDFQLVARHIGSALIAQGHGPIDSPAADDPFAPTDAVLDALDTLPVDVPTSDYPSTDFSLELVITSAVLRPPFLEPARMRADGLLEPDDTHDSVALTLPKIKLSVRQDASTGEAPVWQLDSLGATGLDDTGDIGVAQMVTMDPPYAFIGPGRVIGFGFRSAVLDLSTQSTPPDIIDQFGFDASWTGVYFPEIRLFLAPQGVQGFAVNAGVRNLLIGIGAHSGVTGDFELDVVNQGGGPLDLGARFSLPDGSQIGYTATGDDAGQVSLPATSTITIDVAGRRPPYTVEISVDGGANFVAGRTATIDLSSESTRTIVARASTPDDPTPAELTITARRRDDSGGAGTKPATAPVPLASVTATATTRDGSPVAGPHLVIDSQTNGSVTLRLADRSAAAWSVDGGADSDPLSLLTIDLGPGDTRQVVATAPTTETKLPVYFHYDEPDQQTDAQLTDDATNSTSTSTRPAADEGLAATFPGGEPVEDSTLYAEALQSRPLGTAVTVVGHASWDGDDSKRPYNLELSERRAKVAEHVYHRIAGAGRLVTTRDPRSFDDAKPLQQADSLDNPRRDWWRAELADDIVLAGPITTGTVERDPVEEPGGPGPIVPIDPPPEEPERPDFLRSIGAKVRIIRNDFIAVELHGEIDIHTASEAALDGQAHASPEVVGLGANPADGIIAFRGVFTLNPGSDEWGFNLMFGADPADVDGLAMVGALPGAPAPPVDAARNFLGLFALFFPLLADVAPEHPGSAEIDDIVLTGAAVALPAALTATGWFNVQRVVWYGAEVVVHQHDGEWSTAVLLDVETAVSGAIGFGGTNLITIADDGPLVARYKAIGFRFGADVGGEPIFHPVFDSSKGYSIDLARPGSLTVAAPLDRFLKVIAARVSKTNPTFFEVELGSAVDLGVIALDKVGVRVNLDDLDVELTSLGVSVDLAKTLVGSGYFRISETGFAGSIDVSLVPLKLRIKAALSVQEVTDGDRSATAVALALQVEFPVAIPLYASGLGIYGFIGLFGMHYSRHEEPEILSGTSTVALDWLKRAGGDPTSVDDEDFWRPALDNWAFGLGMIVGTMGSSIVFNMKGIVILELPGPRILLMMKANVIWPMPELGGDAEGNFLAVVDIDANRRTLTIGITIDFTIDPLLQLRIPIEAFFDGREAKNWYVFVGSYPDPIRAYVLGAFDGTGYLMLLGDGSKEPSSIAPSLSKPSGFAISTGLYVSMLWGAKEARLYAELGAGFDAVLGFSPLLVDGVIMARGEMRLFIIFLAAQATLEIRLGEVPGSEPPDDGYRIHGEVCAELDLFFFSIKGCVDFTVEDGDVPPIAIPPLVEGVSMISRSPALVHGTATEDPVDGAYGNAIGGTEPDWASLPADATTDNERQAAWRAVSAVPINVIPVAMFGAPPMVDGVTFLGDPINEASGGRAITRSTDTITYSLRSVDLVGPIGAGNTPTAWWTLHPPIDDNESAQLALLSWVPNPWPKALQRSDELTQTVVDRWSSVCDEAAPATPVLWTFRYEPIGPSATGWDVEGVPWPDPPNTQRSVPPPVDMHVRDRWRCGDPMVDEFRGILAAYITGTLVDCPPERDGRDPGGLRPFDPRGPGVLRGVLAEDDPTDLVLPQPSQALSPAGFFASDEARAPGRFVSAGRRIVGRKATERLREQFLAPSEMLRRYRAGESVPRSATGPVIMAKRPANAEPPTCEARVLASPRFDTLDVPTDPQLGPDAAERWSELGFEPGDLHDAVVLEPGCFQSARVLLFAPSMVIGPQALVVRSLDADDNVVGEVVVNGSHIVSPATLPSPWVDLDGPWHDDIALALSHFDVFNQFDFGLQLFLVQVAPAEADKIVIGLADDAVDHVLRSHPYYVAAVETLSCAEVAREDTDEHTMSQNHAALEAAFDAASGNVALLSPGTSYEVRVGWSAVAANADGDTVIEPSGFDPDDDDGPDPIVESFWFRTTSDPPDRLDAYILTTSPADGERHVFGGEPLTIAFGTHDVLDIFDAFDTRLEVHITAASGRHPDEAETGVPNPLPLDATTTTTITAAVTSPWEDAVGEVVDPDCVDIDVERVRHIVATIPTSLDPATDYLLDIHRVASDAPVGATGVRVFRRGFTTSMFATLSDYARWVIGTAVRHRAVPTGLAASIHAEFASRRPEGAELDRAIQGQGGQEGIEPLPVPRRPAVHVWWESGGAVPQPVAVVIDGTEPLWRDREVPSLVSIDETSMSYWKLTDQVWVEPEAGTDSDAVIDSIIRAPGGQRAIVILRAGARGSFLSIDLLRHAFTEDYLDGPTATDERERIVNITLDRAPWEEVGDA